jgi:predicted signal transduction protein with EAL and GGDEF domain
MVVSDGEGRTIPVTASFGVADFERGDGPDTIIDRADRAMYSAKTAGRNCVRPPVPTLSEQDLTTTRERAAADKAGERVGDKASERAADMIGSPAPASNGATFSD